VKYFIIIFLITSTLFSQETKQFTVTEINENELDQIILERNNKLLLINVWASWCIPCREEFPSLVKLATKFSDDLDIIAISVDYGDEVDSKVIPFLKQVNVNFPVYLNGFKKDEAIINYFNKNWNGGLPGSFLYDISGNQVEFIEGKQSFESFSSKIKEHLTSD
jgi:thiol-disulfide isomerase/thioredoxin